MKIIACLIFFTLVSLSSLANDLEFEFTNLNPDIDTELLNCVNQDLETAAYQTFSSVSMLNKFISLEKGE